MRLVLCLLAAAALVSGCTRGEAIGDGSTQPNAAGAGGEAQQPLALTRLAAGAAPLATNSGMTDSARVVVRNAAEWSDTWKRIWSGQQPTPALAPVDFAREMVVVAALGTRPTGGYAIYVDSASTGADGIEVVVRKVSPGPGCMLTEALTAPVDVARLPRSDAAVRFREVSVTSDCK